MNPTVINNSGLFYKSHHCGSLLDKFNNSNHDTIVENLSALCQVQEKPSDSKILLELSDLKESVI